MSESESFDRLERDVVETVFLHNPILATMFGRHERDDRMGDNGPGAVAAQMYDYAALLGRLRSIAPDLLPAPRRIDRTLLIGTLETAVMRTERLREHERNPAHAAEWAIFSVYFLMLRDHRSQFPLIAAGVGHEHPGNDLRRRVGREWHVERRPKPPIGHLHGPRVRVGRRCASSGGHRLSNASVMPTF